MRALGECEFDWFDTHDLLGNRKCCGLSQRMFNTTPFILCQRPLDARGIFITNADRPGSTSVDQIYGDC